MSTLGQAALASLLLLAWFCDRSAAAAFSFVLGSVTTSDTITADCARQNDVASGTRFFAAVASSKQGLTTFGGADGAAYNVSFQLAVRQAENCSEAAYVAALRQLVLADGAHFLLGSPAFPAAQAVEARRLGRLLFHSGPTPDSVFDGLDLPTTFGIAASPTRYARLAIKAMALHQIDNIALVWRVDDAAHMPICTSALDEYLPSLQGVNPMLVLHTYNYTAAQAAQPGFFDGVAAWAQRQRADALVACDSADAGMQLTQALKDAGVALDALFVADAPMRNDYVHRFGAYAEYTLSATQFHPSMEYADAFFGRSAEYAANYQAATGREVTEEAAGASAAAWTLWLAVQDAMYGCTVVSSNASSADSLLFDVPALRCGPELPAMVGAAPFNSSVLSGSADVTFLLRPNATTATNGYARVIDALRRVHVETFYGPVEFGQQQRNVAKQPVTTQILGGSVQVVLPTEAANRFLVMPAPRPTKGSFSTSAVAGVVLGVVAALVALVALYLVYRRQLQHNRTLFGRVRAPGVGPQTTLLMTDIQSSTALWEALPAEVMEKAMEVHDAIMRSLAAKHDAYESANEGDSFTLAFHEPLSAALFAVKAQQELVLAKWPEALLRHEQAEPVWMTMADDSSGLTAACRVSHWAAEVLANMQTKALTGYSTAARNNNAMSKSFVAAARSVRQRLGMAMGAAQRTSFDLSALPGGDGQAAAIGGRGGGIGVHVRWASLPAAAGDRPDRLSAARTDSPSGEELAAYGRSGVVQNWRDVLMGNRTNSFNDGGGGIVVGGGADNASSVGGHGGQPIGTGAGNADESAALPMLIGTGRRQQQQQQQVLGPLLVSLFRRARPEDALRILAQRGLRVRMGMHSGLTDRHTISVNKNTGATQYGGSFLLTVKRASDAAHGGQVTLTDDTYRQLPARALQRRAWVLHMGQHVLGDFHSDEEDSEYQLYQIMGYDLTVRIALLPPLRTSECLIRGVLDAPVGSVAIVFMYVVGLQVLMAWDSELTMEAVELFHRVAAHMVRDHSGYVSESQEGLVLASFRDPAQALCWALATQQSLIHQPWDEQLLDHELCEELSVVVASDTRSKEQQEQHPRQQQQQDPGVVANVGRGGGPANGIGGSFSTRPQLAGVSARRFLAATNAMEAAASAVAAAEEDGASNCSVPPGMVRKVLMRGLRMRVGVDMGKLKESVSPASSTVVYRGKVMNRAARIAMLASAGQVLVSSSAWRVAQGSSEVGVASQLNAHSLGTHAFKGVSESIEIFHCRLRQPDEGRGPAQGSGLSPAVPAAIEVAPGPEAAPAPAPPLEVVSPSVDQAHVAAAGAAAFPHPLQLHAAPSSSSVASSEARSAAQLRIALPPLTHILTDRLTLSSQPQLDFHSRSGLQTMPEEQDDELADSSGERMYLGPVDHAAATPTDGWGSVRYRDSVDGGRTSRPSARGSCQQLPFFVLQGRQSTNANSSNNRNASTSAVTALRRSVGGGMAACLASGNYSASPRTSARQRRRSVLHTRATGVESALATKLLRSNSLCPSPTTTPRSRRSSSGKAPCARHSTAGHGHGARESIGGATAEVFFDRHDFLASGQRYSRAPPAVVEISAGFDLLMDIADEAVW